MLKQKNKKVDTKQIENLKIEVEEFKNRYLRALADYKNLEHRVNAERSNMRDMVKEQVIGHFLPIMDNINQAEVFTKDPGLTMISNSFSQTLKDLGVHEVELLGQEYDPHSAEVVEVVEGREDNKVVDVLQKAYAMNGQLIRPGRVKVSKLHQSERSEEPKKNSV
ncbi:nucleotide exchange factor GrpE [Candidatus Roizmanbacteria bacterium RIFCSPHIGHO2_12_FULL_38_13]|nr:MAG: nucleotide exchange factor GrpE [Candidatus Roizmanbacteria bacterium RIFCSPHIGHO2_12_FULL_38_13]